MHPLKMYFLLKVGIFHCYVSLPDGNCNQLTGLLPLFIQLTNPVKSDIQTHPFPQHFALGLIDRLSWLPLHLIGDRRCLVDGRGSGASWAKPVC